MHRSILLIIGLSINFCYAQPIQCVDTVNYFRAKYDSLVWLSIVPNTSVCKISEYYPKANQPLTIKGVEFFGWLRNLTSPPIDSLSVKLSIYESDAANNPIGAPLATSSIFVANPCNITAVNYPYFLPNDSRLPCLRYVAMFSSPVSVDSNYCVVFENGSTDGEFQLLCHNFTTGNYNYEGFCRAQFAGNPLWRDCGSLKTGSGYYTKVDFILNPIIEYLLECSYVVSDSCPNNDEEVIFKSTSSSILQSRIYNQNVFKDSLANSYLWKFSSADSFIVANNNVANHSYSANTPVWKAIHVNTMVGWHNTWTISIEDTLCKEQITTVLHNGLDKDWRINLFPNPFNNFTIMEIKLPDGFQGNIKIIIYDILGHEVKMLDTNRENNLIISKDNLNSGMYFYKVTANSHFIMSGKMIVE